MGRSLSHNMVHGFYVDPEDSFDHLSDDEEYPFYSLEDLQDLDRFPEEFGNVSLFSIGPDDWVDTGVIAGVLVGKSWDGLMRLSEFPDRREPDRRERVMKFRDWIYPDPDHQPDIDTYIVTTYG